VEQSAAAAGDLDQLLSHSGIGTAAADDDSVLLTLLGQAAQEGGDATYRVGVRSVPVADDQIGKQGPGKSSTLAGGTAAAAASAAGGSSSAGAEGLLASVIGGKSAMKLHAGVMAVSVVEQDLSSNSSSAADNVQFEVRREALQRGACRNFSRCTLGPSDVPLLTAHLLLPLSLLVTALLNTILPAFLQLQVQLWRAELLSGMHEVLLLLLLPFS
jgi:hypothetical protein